MKDQNSVPQGSIGQDGVAGLKKHTMKPFQIAFLLFCLVAAGAFGIEDMIPTSGPGLTIAMLVYSQLYGHTPSAR